MIYFKLIKSKSEYGHFWVSPSQSPAKSSSANNDIHNSCHEVCVGLYI